MHEDFDINPAELCDFNLFPLYRNLLSRNSERLIPLRKVHLPRTCKLNMMSSLLKEIQIFSNLSIQNCPNKYSSKNVFPTVGIPTSIPIGNSCVQSLKNPSSKLTNFEPLLKCISPLPCLFKSQVCLPH
jgi:hypothetical protein